MAVRFCLYRREVAQDAVAAQPSQARLHSFHYLGMTVEYPDHVRWKCLQCTACCQDTTSHKRCIRILDNEASTICQKTGLKVEHFSIPYEDHPPYTRRMRKLDGRCFFLRDEGCSIYAIRPITCVFYPFFLTRKDERTFRFELTPERCSGLGFGREVSCDEFKQLFCLAVERLRIQHPTGAVQRI